ncbi:DNA polymerase III subunit alpha [Candidatus Peregrinibacteria bacterium]|nr:DNA polymerase III subunit alpha [Candidatus Peregrinibacteria bacterium]
MSFVHLHNHSHYSILTGLARPIQYVELAKEQGSPAVAITDSGVIYGAIEFYQKAKAAGIKPIIGVEAYVAPMGIMNKTPENRYSSLVLLARTNAGYKNLLKLCTVAALEGFYYKPRVDDEVLKRFSSGLIALSGGLSGAVAKAILENNEAKALELIHGYQEIFGKDYFFLEMQHHPEIANWSIVNSKLLELSKATGAPLVAANDCHYAKPEDADAHDVLVCIQTQKTVKDEHRIRFVGNYSLRSPADMEEAFQFCPEAIENTLKIADMVDVEIKFGESQIPTFQTGNKSTYEYLKALCLTGFHERYGDKPSKEAVERFEYELDTIHRMGFESYFLIVQDFINYAKNNGIIVGPGRGSAAGSIIAYSLKITELDPLEYGLLFERFLNPERISMPDIDVDFADTRRDEVLDYVTKKYGEDHVAQIITFGTLAPKAAIRDAGRALGYSYAAVDKIAKTVPPAIFGKYAPLKKSVEEDADFSALYKNDLDAREILQTAIKLEGTIRQVGTHACAVIIARDPLVETTALQKAAGAKEGIVTQYSMKPCDELGLLKMDFLGLKNLTMIETTLGILGRTKPDVKIDTAKLPMDDSATFELLQRGETTGVFQLESAGMKRYLKELRPTEFGDIIAMISLYRPGPMQFISTYIAGKHGSKKVNFIHDSLKEILQSTYGIAIYQEQILQIAQKFAGFSLGQADLLRRAIGKKIAKELMAQREKFLEGSVGIGHDKALAEKIFDEVIEPFAGYGFNKSHAACYALISYQTAFLKAHYPAEFMAALLTADADNTDRVVIEIQECRNMGIEVLPPDVNESRAHFTVVDDKTIRFGLTAVKGIGLGPVREIIAAREKDGKFGNIENFARRVNAKNLNKKTLESLALSGAMDSLGERAEIAQSYEEIGTYGKNAQASLAEGQTDIFGIMQDNSAPGLMLEKVKPASPSQRLKWEKQYLGLYVSGHPLQGLKRYFKNKGRLIEDFSLKMLGKNLKINGMITSVKKITTKTGKYMAMGEIEDPSARIGFVLFPGAYDKCGQMLEEEKVLSFEGKLDRRGNDLQFVINEVKALSLDTMLKKAIENGLFDKNDKLIGVPAFKLEIEDEDAEIQAPDDESDHSEKDETETFVIDFSPAEPDKLSKLKSFLEKNKGDTKAEIHIRDKNKIKRIKVPFGINQNKEFEDALKKIIAA